MQKKMPSAEDLAAIAAHLKYEWNMLIQAATLLQQLQSQHARRELAPGLWSALIESFAVHVRNLIEFLLYGATDKYARAVDFFDDPRDWTGNRQRPQVLNTAQKMANEQIAHLTYGRVHVAPEGREWHVGPIVEALRDVFLDLRRVAAEKKRSVLLRILNECGITDANVSADPERATVVHKGHPGIELPQITAATTAPSTPPRQFPGLHGRTGD
ncbi:hypothetical protein ACFL5Q_01935 [Planctomycetota bacterium]